MLLPGTRIGPYEVTGQLGAGGMGEVYRARDPRLGRDVALKVLPESVSTDADRLARFQREAQVLAALKHPNIGAIYGLEQGPFEGGDPGAAGVSRTALVLELIEGETLAERLERGPVPIGEALPVARQIADALDAAHEQGIIHRDLKPANIRLTPDGHVKVLDFGLAKLSEAGGAGGSRSGRGIGGDDETRTASPVVTSPAMMTGMGVLMGTAAYMAPEQAKGRSADKRSDIWAFGCVLYEMLTGASPFKAEDIAETIALVLTREPDWSKLPRETPHGIRRLLRRTLQKDRRQRLGDAGDARIEIEEALAAPHEPAFVVRQRPASRWRVAALLAITAIVAAIAASVATRFQTVPERPRLTRLNIVPADDAPIVPGGDGRSLAITPDGRRVIYRAPGGRLIVRPLDQLEGSILSGAGNAQQLFVSPDGESVGFFDGLFLKTISLSGGSPTQLTRIDGPGALGASWGNDGSIVFATSQLATGLRRIAADGGDVQPLTTPDRSRGESDHTWPSHLPDGRGILFTIVPASGDVNAGQIAVLAAGSTTPKVVLRGASYARYVSSGHLVYLAGTDLRFVPFDLGALEVTGDPQPLQTGMRTTQVGAADFDVAADGTLVYLSGGPPATLPQRTLAWVDRSGNEQAVDLPVRTYTSLRISPDGTRAAIEIRDQENDIWIWDIGRGQLSRLTIGPAREWWPVWLDNRRVLFGSNQAGTSSLYLQTIDGGDAPQQITNAQNDQLPTSASPDGRQIFFDENNATFDVMTIPAAGGQVTPLLQSAFDDRNAVISPDGRWLAYQSTESGQAEIYVRPYPNLNDGRWQVSTGGGTLPTWSRRGDELFYAARGAGPGPRGGAPPGAPAAPLAPGQPAAGGGRGGGGVIMGVRVETGSTWNAGRPTRVIDGVPVLAGASASFDVMPDGRFLVIRQPQAPPAGTASPPTIVLVQQWVDELRRPQPPR